MKSKFFITIAAVLVALETGCASSQKTSQPLPLEVVGSNTGALQAPRVFERDGRLFVSGRIARTTGTHLHQAAHVDVQLLGPGGRVLAEQEYDIEAPHPRSFGTKGRLAFQVSFPGNVAGDARKVRISYRPVGH